MKRGLKMPVGMTLIAVLALAGLMGLFAFSAAQPAGAQSSERIEYAEGGDGAVATFKAEDPDEDDTVTWTLSGDDAEQFMEIMDDGMLKFISPPDFENPTDSDVDNVYELAVTATDEEDESDSLDVVVEVTNEDEAGEVIWTVDHDGDGSADTPTLMQFQVGAYLEAIVEDGDAPLGDKDVSSETNVGWQWYQSPGKTAMRTPISGATDPVYNVVAADVGKYLHVKATYILTGPAAETADRTSDYQVLAVDANVDAPSFAQANVKRTVKEGDKGMAVGAPVTAMGGHGRLNYALSGTDSDQFDIDQKTGQIKTMVDLDYEVLAGESGNCAARNKCEVTVTATDSAGADSDPAATVTITLVDVDNKPTFTDGEKTVFVEENETLVSTIAYAATDPEGTRINLALLGYDGRMFELDSVGVLSFKEAPNYEMPTDRGRDNVYDVTVRANVDGSRLYADRPVKVTVTEVDEPPEFSGNGSFKYAEDRKNPVVTLMAEDPEGDPVTWSLLLNLEGSPEIDGTAIETADFADLEDFDISEDGALTFDIEGDADFEAPGDADTDNTYNVVVVASDAVTADGEPDGMMGYKKVTVMVTNVAEKGIVTWTVDAETPTLVQFQVGAELRAQVTDGDETVDTKVPAGISPSLSWQWYRSPSKAARGTAITDQTAATANYTVTADDDGKYLRAEATYSVTDSETEEKASLTSEYRVLAAVVEADTPAPTFDPTTVSREVKEGDEGMAVGDPVTATDGHGKLNYTLTNITDNDGGKFEIDQKTGQIKTMVDLSYESALGADDNCAIRNSCVVQVTATDSAGRATTATPATVTIMILDVNEKPTLAGPTKADVDENTTEVTTGNKYEATDPDGDAVTLSLKSGADSGLFRILASDDLAFRNAPDYEDPKDRNRDNVYEVTVRASDGKLNADRTVRITVKNVNEEPEIMKVGSTDATLSALSLSDGTLAPAFMAGTMAYTAMVDNDVESVTVTATPNHINATYAVDGGDDLMVGPNTITVTVTAEDGTAMMEYMITVTRAGSMDAYLSELDLWLYPMTDPMTEIGDLTDTFMADTMSYTVMADNSVAQIKVNAVTSHDDAMARVTAMMGTNTVTVSSANVLALAVGDTKITVKVTAEDGTAMMEYMITVTKAAGMAQVIRNEVIAAIQAYLADDANALTRDQLIALISRYLAQ